MIAQGEQAPEFELPDQDGRAVKLTDLRGTPVVLYFYPRAGTPGCTTQACGVRDHISDYARYEASVVGVSPDPVDAVKEFHEDNALNFPLLADEDHAVCEAYGAWGRRSSSQDGHDQIGALRATFVIDDEGVVIHVIPRADPSTHDAEVLAALEASDARTP